jgi:TonB family protein
VGSAANTTSTQELQGESSAPGNSAPRGNSVALEVPVTATGARGSSSGEQRDLFVEETNTVLVFRDGAVIRLKTDVALAQLVFLTNKKTKREVVCSVRGKRNVPSGHYYVELDFTEAMANFWDVDFGPEEAPRPKPVVTVKKVAPVAPLSSAKAGQTAPAAGTAGTPARPAVVVARAPQTVEENPFADIETFLEIRPAEPPPRVVAEEASAEAAPVERKPETPEWARAVTQAVLEQAEKKEPEAAAHIESVVAAVEPAAVEEAPAEERVAAGSEPENASELPAPDLDFSGKAGASKAKKSTGKAAAAAAGAATSEGSNSRIALLGGLVLVVLLAGAWYENWLPFLRRTSALALPAGGGVTARPRAAAAKNAVAGSADAGKPDGADSKDGADAAGATAASENAAPVKRAERGSKAAAKDGDAANEAPAAAAESAAPVDSNGADAAVIPAKLVKSVQAVYPPDAMRNYITGDVIVDAVVQPNGRVGETNVLTGPAPLRQAAIDALKQYEYAAATQGGKAVASHVKVTVKFWFNP